MRRSMLVLGVILVLLGGLFLARDYSSSPACTCARMVPAAIINATIFNVTNGGEVNGYVLAFRAPIDLPAVTVTDPETGRSTEYHREGELYVPVGAPLPFGRFQISSLGNVTVEVHWQDPRTTVVLDTPSLKPVPGGFEYVQTTEYPLWSGIYAEIHDPRGVIRISPNGTFEIVLTDESLKVASINKTLLGTPRLLKLVYSSEQPSKLWLDGYVEIDGRRVGYTHGISVGRDELVEFEKGFKFSSMLLYGHYPPGNETAECTVTHSIGPAGPLFLALGLLLIFAGVLWKG
ncbi:hypothetical protein E3E36_01890 [Thermococcus sp. M36]|uniref:hypothetical protein n=1 Tax=Thermococcus sp. M36 TaxID=1638261 RepID=UPI00143885DE|nr:hypothetical protein [Thermococcus sp. M36]NJE04921.1 hypothetical protein [Thermococcus sp. M36]